MVIRVFAKQHIKEENKQEKGNCRADGEAGAGKEQTKLIYHERDHIGKAAQVADRAPCPLAAVHLAADSAAGCKAGCAQEVEDHEAVSCKSAAAEILGCNRRKTGAVGFFNKLESEVGIADGGENA